MAHDNKTGIQTSPRLAKEAIAAAERSAPSSEGTAEDAAMVREKIARDSPAMGGMPPPASLRGLGKVIAKVVTGDIEVLLDKLGERLAFERSGVRLYEALLWKHDAYGSWKGGPERSALEAIRDDELRHFAMLRDTLERMGADPTAITPSANVHAVAASGFCQVLNDPRTSLRDCLEVILIAELADNDCWSNLFDLARALHEDELAERVAEALRDEREHLLKVRTWIGAALSGSAMGKPSAAFASHALERGDEDEEARPHLELTAPQRARSPSTGSTRAKRSARTAPAKSSRKKRASSGARRKATPQRRNGKGRAKTKRARA